MGDDGEVDECNERVDQVLAQLNAMEQKVNEIEQFYSYSRGSASKDKEESSAASKRMQELIRLFATILRQITHHKWARPFMEPVDVKGLGLHDYYEVIDKPMDLSTIKKRMEAQDGTAYKHVREICADVRLVFKNAMKYNDENNDYHVMAKTLLAKFEDKWLQFLPKVVQEEKRLEQEEAEEKLNMQLAQEAAYAKMARDIGNELFEVDMNLEELREQLVQTHRKMSSEEKIQLSGAMTKLSAEEVNRVMEMVAQSNPELIQNDEIVELDLDAVSETTLWRLKIFIKDALQTQAKSAASMGATGNNNDNHNNDNDGHNNNNNNLKNNSSKRKREICNAIAKAAKKKTKKS